MQNRRGLWQLKLPGEGERLELEVPGGPGSTARRARRRCSSASCAGRALEPAAVLRTRREGVRARENGRAVADVTVDTVSVLDGRRVRERFVELEVEALEGGAGALPALERVLTRTPGPRTETGGRRPFGRSASFRWSARSRRAGRRRSSTSGR